MMSTGSDLQRHTKLTGPGIRDLLLIMAGVAILLVAERYLAWLDRETLRRLYATDLRNVLGNGLSLRSLGAAVNGGGVALALRVLLSARRHSPSTGQWCVVLLGGYAAVAYAVAVLAGWLGWQFGVRYAAGISVVGWGQLAGVLGGLLFAGGALKRKGHPRLWYCCWTAAAVYFGVTAVVWCLVNLAPSAFHVISYSGVRATHYAILLAAGLIAILVMAYEWWTAGKDWVVGSAAIGLAATLVLALMR